MAAIRMDDAVDQIPATVSVLYAVSDQHTAANVMRLAELDDAFTEVLVRPAELDDLHAPLRMLDAELDVLPAEIGVRVAELDEAPTDLRLFMAELYDPATQFWVRVAELPVVYSEKRPARDSMLKKIARNLVDLMRLHRALKTEPFTDDVRFHRWSRHDIKHMVYPSTPSQIEDNANQQTYQS